MKLIKNIPLVIILFLALLGCERDDICLEGTIGTPHLIIRFYDAANSTTLKQVPNLRIIGVGNNQDYGTTATSDSIAIPLKVLASTTSYRLIYDSEIVDDAGTPNDTSDDPDNGNEDIISITYTNNEIFISRACGFKNTFTYTNDAFVVSTDTDNWINSFTIENNTIEDENNAHIHITH